MTEPVSSGTAGGLALLKVFGVHLSASAIAVALGFLFLWPKTMKEAFIRVFCTVVASSVFGPVLVIAVFAWWPGLFHAADGVAAVYRIDPLLTKLFVAAPIMVLAGLPAWWILGGLVLWFERRRNKDLGEMVADARNIIKPD